LDALMGFWKWLKKTFGEASEPEPEARETGAPGAPLAEAAGQASGPGSSTAEAIDALDASAFAPLLLRTLLLPLGG
jgi:hypothetical protein